MIIETQTNKQEEIRLDKLAQSLPVEEFTPVKLNLDKPKNVWVATVEVELSHHEAPTKLAAVLTATLSDEGMTIPLQLSH